MSVCPFKQYPTSVILHHFIKLAAIYQRICMLKLMSVISKFFFFSKFQGQHPVLIFGGEVSLQTQSGKLVKMTLSTHETSPNNNDYR